MSTNDWAGIIVSAIAIVTAFAGAVRWLVKHFLYELKPNSGSSLKDQVSRLESRVDQIFTILSEKDSK